MNEKDGLTSLLLPKALVEAAGAATGVAVVVLLVAPNDGVLAGFEPKLNELAAGDPNENFDVNGALVSFLVLSFTVLPSLGVSQHTHFSTLVAFFVMQAEHSQDSLFCFSTMDLNIVSAATGADGVASTLLDVLAFPNTNDAGAFCTVSLALSSSLFPLLSTVDSLAFPNVNEGVPVVFAGKLPNENVDALLTVLDAFEPNENDPLAAALPKVDCDFRGAAVAPVVTSRDCSQHTHFDFDSSF